MALWSKGGSSPICEATILCFAAVAEPKELQHEVNEQLFKEANHLTIKSIILMRSRSKKLDPPYIRHIRENCSQTLNSIATTKHLTCISHAGIHCQRLVFLTGNPHVQFPARQQL